MAAYYNEFDPNAAAWLRELIRMGEIPDGVVDERSILDVRPADLAGYTQCHFFAGVAGWPYALRLAGWPENRPCWTGSPPCQPFSVAGQGLSRDDPRHLAPHFVRLVRACRPGVLFGEQVASADVFGKAASGTGKRAGGSPPWAWIDDLCDRLEAARYAVGSSDFPSAGVGAPHIRQRTFFGAVAAEWLDNIAGRRQQRDRRFCREGTFSSTCGGSALTDSSVPSGGLDDICGIGWREGRNRDHSRDDRQQPAAASPDRGMVHGLGAGLERHCGHGDGSHEPGRLDADATGPAASTGAAGRLADQHQHGCGAGAGNGVHDAEHHPEPHGPHGGMGHNGGSGPLHGFWADADWLFCRDDKWRPAQSSVQRVADGVPAELVRSGAFVPASSPLATSQKGIDRNAPGSRRVMRLKGYGNAINPHAAAVFIRAFDAVLMETQA